MIENGFLFGIGLGLAQLFFGFVMNLIVNIIALLMMNKETKE
jgi:F0F1-type ATP synthase assembly protein I